MTFLCKNKVYFCLCNYTFIVCIDIVFGIILWCICIFPVELMQKCNEIWSWFLSEFREILPLKQNELYVGLSESIYRSWFQSNAAYKIWFWYRTPSIKISTITRLVSLKTDHVKQVNFLNNLFWDLAVSYLSIS